MRKLTSPNGINLIKSSESFSAVVYLCPAGKPTIGWGHVIRPADKLAPPISQQQGETLMRTDLRPVEIYLDAIFPGLAQNEFDALASFIFNIGLGAFEKSTMFRLLKAGDKAAAADQFPRWNKAAGKILPGLVKRRAAERTLFLEVV
ncbi:MAG: lysozyme [Sulfuricellaceae bacterium]